MKSFSKNYFQILLSWFYSWIMYHWILYHWIINSWILISWLYLWIIYYWIIYSWILKKILLRIKWLLNSHFRVTYTYVVINVNWWTFKIMVILYYSVFCVKQIFFSAPNYNLTEIYYSKLYMWSRLKIILHSNSIFMRWYVSSATPESVNGRDTYEFACSQ